MKNTVKRQKWIFILAILLPYLGGYTLFTLYPNALSAYYSFFEWNGISEMKFVGLRNYVEMFRDPYVWRALGHNLWLVLIVPLATLFLSAILAYMIVYLKFRERNIHKVIYFLPNVISTVVIGLIWSFIYDGDYGILNGILSSVGLDVKGFYWLGETQTALGAVMAPMIWTGVGFYVIILMNAMTSIPPSMYEAASLDGASHAKRLTAITLPLIASVMRVSLIFLILNAIKTFELIFVLTNGGPEGATDVIGLYMYTTAFGSPTSGRATNSMFGYSSAIGMFICVILVVVNIIVEKSGANDNIEY